LDQHVENLALVIDGTPQIHPLAGDAHHHLVQMPAITPRATLAQPSRDRRTKLQHPAPHRFAGDIEPALGQQFLDIAVAQGEAEIEPDRVLDNLGREAMAAVAERSHADILSDTPLNPDLVSVTKPSRELTSADAPARAANEAIQIGRSGAALPLTHDQINNLFHLRRDHVTAAGHRASRAKHSRSGQKSAARVANNLSSTANSLHPARRT
jgi:hypothetical protein